MTGKQQGARYQEIERWVRERIFNSALGDPLPSETELSEQFSVSRMTARHAVQNLAAEGLVERRRGSGTFVARPPMHRREGALMSFTEDMLRRGLVASSRLLEAGLRSATQSDALALRLDADARVVVIDRLRLADEQPLALERATLAADCASVLADDLEHGSLHESLHRLGRSLSNAHSWISARTATTREAELLEVKKGDPLLVERRIVYDNLGAPIEHTESAYVASRFVIDAFFSVETDVTEPAPSPSCASRAASAAPMAPAE